MKFAITILLSGLISLNASADVSEEQFQLLLQQVEAMSQRLDKLEHDNTKLKQDNSRLQQENLDLQEQTSNAAGETKDLAAKVAVVEKRSKAVSWAEKILWQGDFRPRYEFIDQEGAESRNRMRIRARAALIAKPADNVVVGIGIASGSEDPVSSNQTLGAGGTTKDLNLDMAYFDWTASQSLTIGGGKFRNPMLRVGGHSILWDSDWRPEGVNLRWDNDRFFANTMAAWLEGDSRRDTSFSYMFQAGVRLNPSDNIKLKLGGGYYVYDTQGQSSFLGDGDLFGNSQGPIFGAYLYNYHVLDSFAELGFELFGMPAVVFAEYMRNSEAPRFNTGYSFGFRLGRISDKGSWDLRYAYQNLEKDATFALVADSDFGGGGTDVRGHVVRANYAIDKNWSTGFIYINSENDLASGKPQDFERLQLDILFRFK